MLSLRHFLVITVLTTAVLPCSRVCAQNVYYYSYEVKKPLALSQEKVTIKFLPTMTQDSVNNFIFSEAAFDQNVEPEPTMEDFLVLHVLPGTDIESLIQKLRAKSEVVMANPVYSTLDPMECLVTDQFVAQFYPSVSRSYIDSLNVEHGVIIVDSIPDFPNFFILKLTGSIDKDVLQTANKYNEDLSTYYSHPDFIIEIVLTSFTPNDSFFQHQWNYENTGQIGGKIDADIDAPLAWEICKGNADLPIAVIDDGVELHEDLPNLAQGYDVVGYNTFHPQEDWDPTPGDYCAHGQICAGLIAATQNNSLGISGLAPLCPIVPIKNSDDSMCYPWRFTTQVVTAFAMAGALGAKIASNSWIITTCDSTPWPDIIEAINFFIRPKPSNPEGGVVVFSTGNFGGCIFFPANMDSVIAVGASDSLDRYWSYSSYGPQLAVLAPSGYINLEGDIWSTDLMGARGYNPHFPGPANVNYTARFGGTSAACPQVAATAALIKAQWWRLYPALPCSSYQVKEIIEKSAEDSCYLFQAGGPDTTECFSLRYGYGRLNAFRALLAISRGDANNDKSLTVGDVTYLVNFLFKHGPIPVPVVEMGDANCDGSVTVADVVYLNAYLFRGGPKPKICYKYPHNY
ncbi:MAG: S8 family serine peptidase [candidate division Zixibacteria bacterium]|nr:S8 family serine peptidase [candidate division Zixibacteria bacterium]